MRKLLLAFICIIQVSFLSAQLNMSFLGQLEYQGQEGLDIWGYADENNNEYAIMTVTTGVSIVDVTTPTTPTEIFFANGINASWRDAQEYNDKAYIVNESGDGLMIIDLAPLPGNTNLTVSNYTGNTYPFTTSHNIYIDEQGFAYLFGTDYRVNNIKSTIVLDLNKPTTDPNFEVGVFGDYYLHDGMARGDTLWGGAVNDGFFSAIDVSNKSNMTTMGTKNTPHNFSHNIWVSDDGQTVFTTDEVGGAYLASYDVSDLNNITELDRVQSNPGSNVIPHNTHVIGNYIVTSYYRDGVTIHDVSNPSSMVEVGNYDTSPLTGNGFNGCWGVYPWLPSGNIIASDIEGGLFVLGAVYSGASYLEGNVTDLNTSNPIDNAMIEVLSTSSQTNTNIIGNYSVGIATPGTYDVVYSKLGYKSDTISNVVITAGNTTVQNAQLEPLQTFNFTGQVVDYATGMPVSNADVLVQNAQQTLTTTTNGSGNFTFNSFLAGTYEITAGKWSKISECATVMIDENTGTYTIQLRNGYYDDFSFDNGWQESGSASAGNWERGVPVGTSYNGDDVNPGVDVSSDCNDNAFVTGNGGGSAGTDDVDNGNTILTSPIFDLSTYNQAILRYSRWFYTGGGGGGGFNDKLTITIDNGNTQVELEVVNDNSAGNSSWINKSFIVANEITPTANMRLIIETADDDPGHLVEAGFDKFEIIEGNPVGVNGIEVNDEVKVQPNPFTNLLTITFANDNQRRVELIDITGKVIDSYLVNKNVLTLTKDYPKGVYFVKVFENNKLDTVKKVVKQ